MTKDLITSILKFISVVIIIMNFDLIIPETVSNTVIAIFLCTYGLYMFINYKNLISSNSNVGLLVLEILSFLSPIVAFLLLFIFNSVGEVIYITITVFIIITSLLKYMKDEKDKTEASSIKEKDDIILTNYHEDGNSNNDKQEISEFITAVIGFAVVFCIGLIIIFIAKVDFRFTLNLNVLLVGLLGATIPLLYVFILTKVNKLVIPENKYTKELFQLMQKKVGVLINAVGAGISEEVLFRVAILGLLLTYFDPVYSIIAVSILFMLTHLPQYKDNVFLNIAMFIASLSFGVVYIVTNSIWAPIIAHAVYNLLVSFWFKKHFNNA